MRVGWRFGHGLAAATSIGALLFAPDTAAHLRFPKVKAERWIELRVSEDPIRIGYRVGFGATLAAEQRRAADRDGDFEVSAAEGNAALDARSSEVLSALSVCTGRTLNDVGCRKLERREIERVEAEGWVPGPSGHLHFTWTFRLRERAKDIGALRFEDAYEVPNVEITDVEILPPRHAALTLAGEEGRTTGVSSRFTWIEARRQPGPRVVIASWPPPARTTWGRVVFVAAAVLVLGLGWLGLSRFERSRRPGPG